MDFKIGEIVYLIFPDIENTIKHVRDDVGLDTDSENTSVMVNLIKNRQGQKIEAEVLAISDYFESDYPMVYLCIKNLIANWWWPLDLVHKKLYSDQLLEEV